MITIDELSRIEIKIGTICAAQQVPKSERLLQLSVDFGEDDPRQIISGINAYVSDPEEIVGKQFAFVTNITPRTIFGLESNGMLFAVGKEDTFAFLTPHRPVPPGTTAH